MKRYRMGLHDFSGFTVLELLVVLAILGVIVAFALPAYQDYTIRTKVAEGLSLATAAKTAVSEYYFSEGAWPKDNTSAGLPAPNTITGKWVKSVQLGKDGLISIEYQNLGDPLKIGGTTLALAPLAHPGSLEWVCGRGKASDGSTPAAEATTIDNRYLPANCRGEGKGTEPETPTEPGTQPPLPWDWPGWPWNWDWRDLPELPWPTGEGIRNFLDNLGGNREPRPGPTGEGIRNFADWLANAINDFGQGLADAFNDNSSGSSGGGKSSGGSSTNSNAASTTTEPASRLNISRGGGLGGRGGGGGGGGGSGGQGSENPCNWLSGAASGILIPGNVASPLLPRQAGSALACRPAPGANPPTLTWLLPSNQPLLPEAFVQGLQRALNLGNLPVNPFATPEGLAPNPANQP